MIYTFNKKSKIAVSMALFTLCLLVLFSNYIDRNHTNNVKKSISTLYEDRLIAEDYILKMTSSLYQIKELLHTDGAIDRKDDIYKLVLAIHQTNKAYHKTKFTKLENIKANQFLTTITEFETTTLKNTTQKVILANKALFILKELSEIQLAESKQIMDYAEKLYLSGKTSSQFVFALIIVILIALQALVFTSQKIMPRVKSKYPSLN